MAGGKSKYGEELTSFYVEDLCLSADAIYRLSYALTMDEDASLACTNDAFKDASDNLVKLSTSINPVKSMVQYCFKDCQRNSGRPKGHGRNDNVTRFLKSLSPEVRAALVAVDVVGLSVEDAGEALGWGEQVVRKHLAEGRKALNQANIEV